eukprot:gene242-193_t
MRVAAGDLNGRAPAICEEAPAESELFGRERGNVASGAKNNGRQKHVMAKFRKRGVCMQNTFHKFEDRGTYKPAGTEIDHFLTRRMGKDGVVGMCSADLGPAFKHRMVIAECKVRSRRKALADLGTRGERRRMVFKKALEPDEGRAFNDMIKTAPATLTAIQEILVASLPDMKEPEKKGRGGKMRREDVPGTEGLKLNAKDIWDVYARPKKKPPLKISGMDAAVQFQKVGNSRRAGTNFEEAVPEVMRFPDHEIAHFEAKITLKEVAAAIRGLRPEGAPDSHGLVMRRLRHMDQANQQKLTDAINREIDENQLSAPSPIHHCRCSPMFKGGGLDRTSAADHRFLVISGVMIKVIQQILSLRIYNITERIGLHPQTAFGFRAGLSTQAALTMYFRMAEDLASYSDDNQWVRTFMEVWFEEADIAKAFPSLNWEFMTYIAIQSGVGRSKNWAAASNGHRRAEYYFNRSKGEEVGDGSVREGAVEIVGGKIKTTQIDGCKEGRPSSNRYFGWGFSNFINAFVKKHPGRGLRLFANTNLVCAERDEVLAKILSGGHNRIMEVMTILFADDANFCDEIRTKALGAGADSAGKEMLDEFAAALRLIGSTENESKRRWGPLVDIATKLLGMKTRKADDGDHRIARGWANFFGMMARLVGAGRADKNTRGLVLVSVARMALIY